MINKFLIIVIVVVFFIGCVFESNNSILVDDLVNVEIDSFCIDLLFF